VGGDVGPRAAARVWAQQVLESAHREGQPAQAALQAVQGRQVSGQKADHGHQVWTVPEAFDPGLAGGQASPGQKATPEEGSADLDLGARGRLTSASDGPGALPDQQAPAPQAPQHAQDQAAGQTVSEGGEAPL